MSSFTTPLVVTTTPNGRYWHLIEEFEYHIGSLPSDEIIKVPAGFKTDFTSVPKILWPIISPYGIQGKAAVIHDYCYATGYVSQKRSDEIFLEGMKVLGVSKWRRYSLFWALRLGGSFAWRSHKKRRESVG